MLLGRGINRDTFGREDRRQPFGCPAALGEVVAIIPNHVCPVVDLFDELTVVHADGSVETWPVDARGRSG